MQHGVSDVMHDVAWFVVDWYARQSIITIKKDSWFMPYADGAEQSEFLLTDV